MQQEARLKRNLELLWWIITAIVIAAVLWPIFSNSIDFPFLFPNIIFIVIFITFTRYLFQLKHTFLGKKQKIKAAIMLLSLPLAAFVVQYLHNFQAYFDENDFTQILQNMSAEDLAWTRDYIKKEYLFFGIGSFIAIGALFFRLVVSIWRFRNKGTI